MQFFGPSPAPTIVPVPAPIQAFAEQEAEVLPLAARAPIPVVGLPPAPAPLLHGAPLGPAPIDYEEVIIYKKNQFKPRDNWLCQFLIKVCNKCR
jgi:hypothetical protein